MTLSRLEREIAGIAALEEPARRALYLAVVERGGAVSRDQAAADAGVSRALAAFHLDKLVEAGLLVPEFRRLTGRSGPGAGRPAKLYRRSTEQVAVSLPPRSYALVASLFADALERSPGAVRRTLARTARAFGRRLGREARARAGGRSAASAADAAVAALEPIGFEPAREGAEVRLRNCPFHALAAGHTELVCGANLALMEGLVAGLGAAGGSGGGRRLVAVRAPEPGMCCVALKPAPGRPAGRRPRSARRG